MLYLGVSTAPLIVQATVAALSEHQVALHIEYCWCVNINSECCFLHVVAGDSEKRWEYRIGFGLEHSRTTVLTQCGDKFVSCRSLQANDIDSIIQAAHEIRNVACVRRALALIKYSMQTFGGILCVSCET